MKLLMCKTCRDVFNLARHEKKCSCGAVGGRYTHDDHAEYFGDAIPFAVDNASFMARTGIDARTEVNAIYDAWYGEGKIQCWLMKEGMPNFETIRQVDAPKPEQPRKLGYCGLF